MATLNDKNQAPLPPAGAPAAAFARLFDDAAGSYKFLWFLAILDSLPSDCKNDCVLPLPQLVLRMLENAEEPLRRFRLHFGYHDKMGKYLATAEEFSEFVDARSKGDAVGAANILRQTPAYPKMLAMAPLFLLSPFLPDYVNKKSQKVVRRFAKQLADEGKPPLYYFSDDDTNIVIPAVWAEYLCANYEIVRGWALWHWARFLQARNRNVPGVIAKILKPSKGGLTASRDFWKRVIQREPDKAICIYSEKNLAQLLPNDFEVDHFLPWEFVCHDNLWNLVPTFEDINMSKGARLPCAKLVSRLARLHHMAIGVYHSVLRDDKKYGREEMMLSYFADLGVNAHDTMPAPEKLEEAYTRVIPAWIALAKNRGFDEWNYTNQGTAEK